MRNYLPFDFEATMNQLFIHILSNWNTIKYNSDIMSAVNMDTNSLCRYFKEQNPTICTSFVQAYVLSFLIVMKHVIESNISLSD